MPFESIKNNALIKISFLVIAFFLLFFIALFFYYQNYISNFSSAVASTNSKKNAVSPGLYIAYTTSNPQTENQFSIVSLHLYHIDSKISQKIYTIPVQKERHDPLFRKFQNSILIEDAEPQKNILIDLNGKILEESIDDLLFSGYVNSVFSSTGRKYAFPQPRPTLDGLFELSIVDENKKKDVVPGGGETDESGILFPLHWSTDERFLYTYHQRKTEGYIAGVEKLDTQTFKKERLQPVDELQLIQYTFDASENLYAVSLKEIEMFGWENTTHIYQVTPENTVQTFELKNSKINRLLAVDPAGRVLPYIASQVYDYSLWLYNFQDYSETQISADDFAQVPNTTFWHGDKFFFIENQSRSVPSQPEYSLQYYDSSAQKIFEIINLTKKLDSSQKISQFIGWFVIP